MRNLFKPLFICWGIISLVLLILAGGVLVVSYFFAAQPMAGMHVIGGNNLPTAISLNNTDFVFSILSLWLLFSIAALNLVTVILMYFYNSSNNKEKHNGRKMIMKKKLIILLLCVLSIVAVVSYFIVTNTAWYHWREFNNFKSDPKTYMKSCVIEHKDDRL